MRRRRRRRRRRRCRDGVCVCVCDVIDGRPYPPVRLDTAALPPVRALLFLWAVVPKILPYVVANAEKSFASDL